VVSIPAPRGPLKPLAAHPLVFGDLLAIHLPVDLALVTLCTPISTGCSEIPPHIGKHIVRRHAFAIVVLDSWVWLDAAEGGTRGLVAVFSGVNGKFGHIFRTCAISDSQLYCSSWRAVTV
jgi:hypothetical protein